MIRRDVRAKPTRAILREAIVKTSRRGGMLFVSKGLGKGLLDDQVLELRSIPHWLPPTIDVPDA